MKDFELGWGDSGTCLARLSNGLSKGLTRKEGRQEAGARSQVIWSLATCLGSHLGKYLPRATQLN